jgi:hypothetical protein
MSKVKDTKGRFHSWNLTGHTVADNNTRPRSEIHLKTRELLKVLYPLDTVLEEVPIPGESLFADFYLPLRKKIIEVHGEQHYRYISHFHNNLQGFKDSKERDARKANWCAINNITLIVLKYNEEEKWASQITA